jgi:hydroxymethylpyrimidine/phosphomethylpyrimidine kinase
LVCEKLSPKTKIVWDTVLKSSKFNFTTIENQAILIEILKEIDLITPNYNEILQLSLREKNPVLIVELSKYCSTLLKGGHNPFAVVLIIYIPEMNLQACANSTLASENMVGCIIIRYYSQFSLGTRPKTACSNAKNIETYLQSNQTKIRIPL